MKFVLQDKFLDALRDDQTLVTVSLNNGIRLLGRIESYDQYVVTVTDEVPQMVFKHAIAFIRSQQSAARPRPQRGAERQVERSGRHDTPAAPSPAVAKEPVVIVRKKLRTLVRVPDDSAD